MTATDTRIRLTVHKDGSEPKDFWYLSDEEAQAKQDQRRFILAGWSTHLVIPASR